MKHLVVDTSYLLHLFDVDGHSDAAARDEIRNRALEAAMAGCILYVPVPVVFELCNHVAQVSSGASRRRLAISIRDAVSQSLKESVPWTITPFEGDDSMLDWVRVLDDAVTSFSEEFSAQEIGLTDIAIIRCANTLHDAVSVHPLPRPPVHIWTLDEQLKAREPDREVNPFVVI